MCRTTCKGWERHAAPLSGPWCLPTQPWRQDQIWSGKCGAGLTERGCCLLAMAPRKSFGRSAATHTLSQTPLTHHLTNTPFPQQLDILFIHHSKQMRASLVAAKLLLRRSCAACAVHAVAKSSDCCCAFTGKSANGWHCFLPAIQPAVAARLNKLHGVVASCHCALPAGYASMQFVWSCRHYRRIAANPSGTTVE